jgi:ASC-1-like (ASCH) protein
MEHIAIMKKSLGYLDKIISGRKIIESRWYNSKISPWGKIEKGDVVYFKNSGCDIKVKSIANKVIQYENLTPDKIKKILSNFEKQIGISDPGNFLEEVKNKRYCILIFLEDVEKIPPFAIDKRGFGIMSAWISVDSVDMIKL